mgnify:CR=1 FL=1
MQHDVDGRLTVLLGDTDVSSRAPAWKPFDKRVVEFLAELSRRIFAVPDIRRFPDLISLAYWCRPASLARLVSRHSTDDFLVGRGLAFHIPPSNVPLNFAYSLFCGLLSGNSNIVRLSSTESAEVNELVEVMRGLSEVDAYREVCDRVSLVRYGHDDEVTRHFSMSSAARVIWGGNETVRRIRSVESAPRCVDIAFADRVSVSLIDTASVSASTDADISELAERFVADGYTFEQNACSSPRLIIWYGTDEAFAAAAPRFWGAVEQKLMERETLSPAHHMQRFLELCEHLAVHEKAGQFASVTGGATRIELPSGADWREYSGLRFGTFTETKVEDLDMITGFVSADVQTLGYHGFTREEMKSLLERLHMTGVDRAVPIGQALNFDTVWDGYDLIRSLTRTIVII